MKALLILTTILTSSLALADAKTFLTADRVNYKPEKRLRYDLNFDPTKCEIDTTNPFDVYYIDLQSGARLSEFSSNSQEYFGPALDSRLFSAQAVILQFKALDEIQTRVGTPTQVLVHLDKSSGACTPVAEIKYGKKNYILRHMDIKVSKTFGMPTGVEWVLLKGLTDSGPVADCVLGTCK